MESESEIVKFFENRTIFITGGTGFLGNILLEKLLRTCKTLDKIYLLVRPKKGKSSQDRIEEIFKVPCMEQMKKINPNYKNQIFLITGDLMEQRLGLDANDEEILKKNVEIVIHCAATVKFNEKLKIAAYINVRSTSYLLGIAEEMEKLKAFVHVSTAFSHCPRGKIEEKCYEPPMRAEKLLQLVDSLDDTVLNSITPNIIGKWPNTYVFTKAIAEGLIQEASQTLPVVLCRPSIVTCSEREPMPGWISSIYGPSALIIVGGLGLLRTVWIDNDMHADVVPVDYVINNIIAAAFDTAKERQLEIGSNSYVQKKQMPIYNMCNSSVAPITWNKFLRDVRNLGLEDCPSSSTIWYPSFTITKSYLLFHITFFIYETIPALLVDAVLFIIGKKTIAMKLLAKGYELLLVLSYFTLREWDFRTDNTRALWGRLSPTDQKLFHFNLENFNWTNYIRSYCRGIRMYIVKDPIETVPKARKKLRLLYFAYVSSFVLLFSIIAYLLKILILLIMNCNDL